MCNLDDLEAEWQAVKDGSLEPDPVKIAKAEEEFQALKERLSNDFR